MKQEKTKSIFVETDENGYVTSITRYGTATKEELDKLPTPEFQNCYRYIDDEFVLDEERYKAKLDFKSKISNNMNIKKKIFELKKRLSNDDYKIIKCIESQIAGDEIPYDMNRIHLEREKIRQEINELESQLI